MLYLVFMDFSGKMHLKTCKLKFSEVNKFNCRSLNFGFLYYEMTKIDQEAQANIF
jgi:hypothetical protein